VTIPVYNPDGLVVGRIERDGAKWVLRKVVDSRRHQLREPKGWCVAEEHLRLLEELGGGHGVVELRDERGRVWSASTEAFRRYGQDIERGGYEPQLALPEKYWRVRLPGAEQLSLPLG